MIKRDNNYKTFSIDKSANLNEYKIIDNKHNMTQSEYSSRESNQPDKYESKELNFEIWVENNITDY